MEIILCPKEWTKERSFVHSFVEDESEEELVHGDDLFVPSTGPILCTKEFADEYSLMHYRRGGEKKGIRRWQNEDGSYTSAGREHYAEMYGWGKFRADRAQAKSDKYARKAEHAKAELDKRQVQSDRAHVKLDRKGTDKAAEKSKLADSRLNEAKLRYDTYSMKANKYQNKSDKLHNKWDDDTRRLEDYALQLRKDAIGYHYLGQFDENDKELRKGELRNLENAKRLESELARRGIKPKIEKGNKDGIVPYQSFEKVKAVEDRTESNRFVEGSKAFKENAELNDKIDKFGELDSKVRKSVEKQMRTQMDEDLEHIIANRKDLDDIDAKHQEDAFVEYRRNLKALQKNYDQLSPEMQKYAANAMARVIAGDGDGIEGSFNEIRDSINFGGKLGKANDIKSGYKDSIESWFLDRMNKKSGNMNNDHWKPGSRGEKAAKEVHAEWDKQEARAKEVMRKNGITDSDSFWNPDSKDYKKLQKALKDDSLYKALRENGTKSENDLVKAVAQDMGFHITSEILNALGWFVWEDVR